MLLCTASGISVTYCCRQILPRGPYASILGEGYAGLARRRADRAHSLPPSSRRAAPPIYPDLIYDRHSWHPAFPAPSVLLGERSLQKLGRIAPRERGVVFEIARLTMT